MVGKLQPLSSRFPIVNTDGTPTLYMTQWAQQRMEEIGVAVDVAKATEISQEVVNLYDQTYALQAGSGIGITPDGHLSSNPVIAAKVQEILDQIATSRGSVLYRGAAGWQALNPGTSGYVLQTNGPGADPTWAAQSGGGGGGTGYAFAITSNTQVSTSAFATKGRTITPIPSVTLTGVSTVFTVVAGATYKLSIIRLTEAVISEVVATAPILPPTTGAGVLVFTEIVAPLIGGLTYGIVITRTDSTATSALGVQGAALTSSAWGGIATASVIGSITLASSNPAIGQTVNLSTSPMTGDFQYTS
jgi:hypothetical protein